MEFLTDHLLSIRLTGPGPMNTDSEEQHDNFARQLSALEKLLVISHSKLSLEELHKNLKLVLKAGNKGMLKLTSINSLIECVELYKTTATSTQESERISLYFENFLKEVAHLAQVKKFFHDAIYHCLYEFFYDPEHDDSDDNAEQDGLSDEEEDAKSDHEHQSPTPSPNLNPDYPAPFQIQAPKPKKKKKKAANSKPNPGNGTVKKVKRKDNRLKVLERIQKEKAEREALLAKQKLEEPQSGKQFEKLKNKTDRQRLAFAVKGIFEIQAKWNNLITQGPINIKDFEEESIKQVGNYKGYLPVEAVFRLIPDILAKGFRIIELSKIWYNCSRRLADPGPVHYRTMPDFLEKIRVMEQKAEAIEQDMKYKKESKLTKQSERKLLVNQVLRFDQVKEKYDICVEKERELKEYYKQLKQERNAEYPKLEKLSREDTKYREGYEQIQYLADSMRSVYRELQTASYELALVKQDYTVEMGARANLIRTQDDIKFAIQDIDISLPIDEEQRQQTVAVSERIRAKCRRMWIALYQHTTDENLREQAGRILKNKYWEDSINRECTKSAESPHNPADTDSDGLNEEELEKTLTDEKKFAAEFDREDSHPSISSPDAPPPPISPRKGSPAKLQRRETTEGFNPSTAGILDQNEAKEYRDRVERLKKKFELDLSGLKCKVDCEVTPRDPDTGSGEEADMDSEGEDKHSTRPQSKRYSKRQPDRYSPLSDASDEYIFQQQKAKSPSKPLMPPKTVYILKKSKPKEPPTNRYILKKVPGANIHSPPSIEVMPDQHYVMGEPPGNDYETLAALDNNFINTLSVYKKSPLPGRGFGNALTPVLPLSHEEGIFTPLLYLSDGDISIDSGTGNSLDSADEADKKRLNKKGSGYKHKSRLTVREQFVAAKVHQAAREEKKKVPSKEKSKLPTLQRKKPAAHKGLPHSKPPVQAFSPVKSSPESMESRPYLDKPTQPHPNDRSTLFTRKPNHPLPPTKAKPPKDLNDHHPLAPAAVPLMNKSVQRKLPLGKAPKFKPVTVPKQRIGHHVRIIESASDDDIDEIFKQSSVKSKLPPKPAQRQTIAQTKNRRRPGYPRLTRAY